MEFVKVAKKQDIAPDTPFRVTVEGREVVLFCIGGTFQATPCVCPHREGPLHEGLVEGKTITCPYHFSRFDLETGDVLEEAEDRARDNATLEEYTPDQVERARETT